MSRFRNFQTNFSGGLLSSGMLGRLDLAQYETGCKQLENWWPKATGGVRRRPGSIYLNTVVNAVRVESFIFNETQTYAVVFASDSKIYIYDNTVGTLLQTLTVTTTWSAQIAKDLHVTQRGDVMFLAHELWLMKKITRTSATTFTLTNWQWEGVAPNNAYPKKMPFIKYADADITIEVDNYLVNGAATVTASDPVFEAYHVGTAIRYRGKQMLVGVVTGPYPATTCTVTIKEELDRGCTLTFNATLESPQDFLIDEVVVGRDSGIKGVVISKTSTTVVLGMIAGIFPAAATEKVEGLTSGNVCTITASSTVDPVMSLDWEEEAFSDEKGYPSVIEFHSQRLWLAGSSSLPAHLYGSRVAAFFNFDTGDAFAADSIQVSISGNQINRITDIVSGRHLQIFTDAGEFYAPESVDGPLIPATFDLLKQTGYGSKFGVHAVLFDESTLFAQAQGNAIRQFVWQDNQRGYSSEPVSLIAEEFINGLVEMEVLYGGYDRPEQLAFLVNGDGTISWYHAARAEQIRSWGIWTTDGNYKSLTVIQDKLYALVERNSVIMLERFELDVTLDCAVEATGTAASVWSGHHPALANLTVQVTNSATPGGRSKDYYLGEYEYTGGVLDLGLVSVDNVTIGLGFTQTLETMPIEVQNYQGVTTGLPKRLVSADVFMASTLAAQMAGNRITTYFGQDDLSLPPASITGSKKFYLLGYSERPTLIVENDIPLQCEILSLGAEVEY